MKLMRAKPLLSTGMLTKVLVFIFLLNGFGQTLVAESTRPNLSGTVLDESDKPVPNATVFIYTAGPKDGAGILCPSCYADCRKRATSDADGKFLIESLDPELLFRVLVVGKDHQPKFVGKVDPAKEPLTVKLKPRRGGESKEQRLEGRVVDSEKNPISGAVINIRSVTRDERTQFGGNTNVDPVAVSDDSGHFVINSTEPFDAAGVDVEARGFAKSIFKKLATGGTVHELKLTEGTTLKGRAMFNGKPLAGIEIGVAGADRNSEIFAGSYSVATDKDGRFLFSNLPPRTQFYVYGIAKSLKGKGCIPAQSTKTGDDGSTQDLGDISVQPGFVLEGKIVLTDGKPLPKNLRVVLGREQAWDPLEMLVKKDGSFRFTDLPPESVSLSARVKGYHLSLRNASLDPYNPLLIGRIYTNKTDLILEFVPGAERERGDGDQLTLREEPLRGVEKTANPVGDIKVTGTVVDAESKKPLPTFAVVEGRNSQFGDQIDWLNSRRTEYTNGAFTHFFTKQRREPAVMIEAEGYLPMASGIISTNGTNLVFELKRGTGFKGIVLKPDGTPATNVTIYLTDMKNSVYVSDGLKVRDDIYIAEQRRPARMGAEIFRSRRKLTLTPLSFLTIAGSPKCSSVSLRKILRFACNLMGVSKEN